MGPYILVVTAATRPDRPALDFERAPYLVIWETTQACDLACLHCRACAQPRRDPGELSTDEAKRLMATVARFGRPLFVLTGGDPLKRPDVLELVRHGTDLGLRVAMTPSGTPLMTPDVLHRLADAGLARLAVSLDGASAAVHDRFRGVAGSFEWSVRMLRAARRVGLTTQVNTTISRHSLADLEQLIALMRDLDIALWSVFFVVPTGRASLADLVTPEETERVLERLAGLAEQVDFDIKTTAAPHYRRVLMQRRKAARRAAAPGAELPPVLGGVDFGAADGVGRARGVNDADGFVFISHRGDIYPSGFLPLRAGNVRTDDLVQVYRTHPLFVALRDRDRLRGKCGTCEYRQVCGGSRARAYAMTGDPLEADPQCSYVPPLYAKLVERGLADDVDEYFARRIYGWGLDVFRHGASAAPPRARSAS